MHPQAWGHLSRRQIMRYDVCEIPDDGTVTTILSSPLMRLGFQYDYLKPRTAVQVFSYGQLSMRFAVPGLQAGGLVILVALQLVYACYTTCYKKAAGVP